MRLVILTTETSHHAYFVQEILAAMPLAGVIIETQGVIAPFETAHPYEQLRNNYEWDEFFSGSNTSIAHIFENSVSLPDINAPAAITLAKEMQADIFLTFGTRKLSGDFIEQCGAPIINLHGGDPERYRGLDTHLWAIYHGDFLSLISTIHRLNRKLDDGEIILQSSLPITKGLRLHELRAVNTKTCVKLALGALDIYKRTGNFTSRPQLTVGRYYSFMPSCLKDICVQRFNRYAARPQ